MRSWTLSLFLILAWTTANAQFPDAASRDNRLGGTWEITAMIDNGTLIPEAKISEEWIRDSRVYISGQMLSFIKPGNQSDKAGI